MTISTSQIFQVRLCGQYVGVSLDAHELNILLWLVSRTM
jgi:hypothetical protein